MEVIGWISSFVHLHTGSNIDDTENITIALAVERLATIWRPSCFRVDGDVAWLGNHVDKDRP